MKSLYLGHGKRALVDDDIYELAYPHGWYAHKSDTNVYARGWVGNRLVFLHRFVMGLPPGGKYTVDHISRDTLDCRRSNLRLATIAENAQNQGSRGGSSRYRGVSYDRSRRKWMASAQLNGRKVTIGRFASEDEAGEAASRWRAEHMSHAIEGGKA